MTATLLAFYRFLRINGFPAGTAAAIAAVRAVREVNILDRSAVQFALRALICTSKEECDAFDRLFEEFFSSAIPLETAQRRKEPAALKVRSPEGRFSRSVSSRGEDAKVEANETLGASAVERLKRTDFTKMSNADLQSLEEIALRLWKLMSLRLVRRLRSRGQREHLDLRRVVRHSIPRGGEPLDLLYKGRTRKRIHMAALLDVSGSMDLYSLFLLRFIYALHRYFKRIDSFLFATRLTYVSPLLRQDTTAGVIAALSQNVQDWSGGTRIGECLREFNRKYAQRILKRHSLVLILSDGWDTGEPELLAGELRSIKRRAAKVIWLNPLLGMPGYRPLTRGMSAALPLADVFAPAHNLESLLALEKHLV